MTQVITSVCGDRSVDQVLDFRLIAKFYVTIYGGTIYVVRCGSLESTLLANSVVRNPEWCVVIALCCQLDGTAGVAINDEYLGFCRRSVSLIG